MKVKPRWRGKIERAKKGGISTLGNSATRSICQL